MDLTEETSESLQWLDYVIIATILLVSASIGIYYRFTGGRQKTTEEYFLANRSMSVPLLSIALMVTFVSSIALLGESGENYIYGAQYVVINVGTVLGTPIAALFYLPVFFRLQNMSVYEYLEARFGRIARLSASVANFVQCSVYTGVILYGPALALEATTGLSSTTNIFVVGLICTFYSSIGGIKAVRATDVFQGFVMFASVLCVISVACSDIEGGISGVWQTAVEDDRLNVFNFDIDPTVRHTWWSLTIGGCFYFLSNFAVNQIYVQRLLSAKSLKSAQISLFVSMPMVIVLVLSTSFSGLVLYTWFKGCDPVTSGQISSFDQVMPYFARKRLSKIPGLLGFFTAGIFSAALSTVSATLTSLSAVVIADYVKPLCDKFGRELTDSRATFVGKIICIANGLLCMAIAFLASGFGGLLQTALSVSGAIGGPVLGLFSLGIFVETANEIGAVIGTFVSLAFMFWITFGLPKPPTPKLVISVDECLNSTYIATGMVDDEPLGFRYRNAEESDYFYLYRISYMWYTPLGTITAILFGYIASTVVRCFSKNPIAEPDPDLFTPMLAARMRRRRESTVDRATSHVFVFNTKDFRAQE